MIGKMVGYPNAVVGFLVHLVISAGHRRQSFGLLLGPVVTGKRQRIERGHGLRSGLVGAGPLDPDAACSWAWASGVNWNTTAAPSMLPSLMGHAIFGLVLGFVYSRGENCFLLKMGRTDQDIPAETRSEIDRLICAHVLSPGGTAPSPRFPPFSVPLHWKLAPLGPPGLFSACSIARSVRKIRYLP